jgi:hypothetical protein
MGGWLVLVHEDVRVEGACGGGVMGASCDCEADAEGGVGVDRNAAAIASPAEGPGELPGRWSCGGCQAVKASMRTGDTPETGDVAPLPWLAARGAGLTAGLGEGE